MKVCSFFAGVGGIDKGFEKAGFNIIWANEIDKLAVQTYASNFKCDVVRLSDKAELKPCENILVHGDIHKIAADSIPDFEVMVAGFPCQAFSVAGYRKGFKDDRGNLFFELARIFEKKKPQIIFLENVKNLVSHDGGNTFRVILKALEDNGYHVKYQVLNACDYGNLPQNRERIYVVAFLNKKVYEKFDFPKPVKLTKKIRDCVSADKQVDETFLYTPEKCKFYDELAKAIVSEDTLYQWRRVYVRENKSQLCPTLTANMGTGGHNVPLIKTKYGIRKLTPKECFSLMGFPKNFKLPKEMANSHLYKQAGNSVVVPVIYNIAKNIKKALEDASEV
ncbi:DNA cytosine methyltransferase [Turicimonas muris]|uniref:DNA cytosine methyltransferase n=1 Tax=Turicimonas muris TaxID=1796652 RepID=UPI0024956657|nr:DNA cytosine methyltransferase [Turicimonas muris]